MAIFGDLGGAWRRRPAEARPDLPALTYGGAGLGAEAGIESPPPPPPPPSPPPPLPSRVRARPQGRAGAAPPPAPPPVAAGASFGIDLFLILHLLRRRRWLIVLLSVVLTGIAALLIKQLPSRYTAEALVVLNVRQPRPSDLMAATDGLVSRAQSDVSVLRTETDILGSTRLREEVVRRLDLLNDPAFDPSKAAGSTRDRLIERVAPYLGAWRSLLPATGAEAPAAAAPGGLDRALDRATADLAKIVTIANDGGAYTLRIRAETRDPELSARIANGLAEAYLDDQEQQRLAQLSQSSAWLANRLKELRAAVLASDEALTRHRADYRLGAGVGSSRLDAQMTELNSAIVVAQTRASRAQSELDVARSAYRGGRISDMGVVLASPTVQTLRQQESEILLRISQLDQSFGARHPRRLEAEAQLAAVQAKIDLEVQRVLASLQTEASAAAADLAALEARLRALDAERLRQAPSEVTLAALEREARANRDVYDEFLKQLNISMAQESARGADARLADTARPPLEPSGPKRKVLLLGAGFCAVSGSVLLALLLGWWRGGFAGAEQLEGSTGLRTLETVPELSRHDLAQLLLTRQPPDAAATIRSLALALEIRLRQPDGGAMVLITSALPAEGKSMLTLASARALMLAGKRVLLVDLDLWRPTLARVVEVLGLSPLERQVEGVRLFGDDEDRLVLALPDGRDEDESLTDRMRRLIEVASELRHEFDLTLMDAPPVLTTPEVLLAAESADATVLAVRFESTRAAQLRLALRKLATVGVTPVGTVLSRVKPRRYRRYGYGRLSYSRA